MNRDFPGSPVVKNQPFNSGNVGSLPGWGIKIPHGVGQLLSPHATLDRGLMEARKSQHAAVEDLPYGNEDSTCCN